MKIENLTWHNIKIFLKGWWEINIAPVFGKRLQLVQSVKTHWEINWVPVIEQCFGIDANVLEFFAPRKEGVIYIVSSLCAQYICRDDLYIVGQKVNWVDRKTVIGCSWICKNPFIYND
jgi:hypothetical protein